MSASYERAFVVAKCARVYTAAMGSLRLCATGVSRRVDTIHYICAQLFVAVVVLYVLCLKEKLYARG